MGSTIKQVLAAVAASAFTATAGAAVLLSNASQGLYNAGIGTLLDTGGVNDPFPCANVGCGDTTATFLVAPDLSAAAAPLGDWLVNPAAPGGAWSASQQVIPLSWAVNTETAIIYEIDGGSTGLTNLLLSLGVDNGVFVWLDGAYQFGARRGGGSTPGEYTLNLSDLSAGTHHLQILREDHGGGTGFDIRLTGDTRQIPEPGSLALAGLAALVAGMTRRRRAGA